MSVSASRLSDRSGRLRASIFSNYSVMSKVPSNVRDGRSSYTEGGVLDMIPD